MRIVVDIQGAQTESRYRGIGRYSMSLLKAMIRNAGDHEIFVAANNKDRGMALAIQDDLKNLIVEERIKYFTPLNDIAWHSQESFWRRNASELMREYFLSGLQPDAVHISSLFEGAEGEAVTSIGKHSVAPFTAPTLYDLIPLLNQEKYLTSNWSRRWYMDKIESLQRSDLLLSISEYARNEAMGALNIEADRIVNISSAISEIFKPLPVNAEVLQFLMSRFGIHGRYVMYSGAMEPRKNAERLLEAFAMLTDASVSDAKLVIAGKIATHDLLKFDDLISRLGIGHRTILTGYVSDEELIKLYSACSAYVFPSLHEGFGLPALEAMACGAPTIGSSTTSIPEVIGRKDALFDPLSVFEISEAIKKVLVNEDFLNSLKVHAEQQCQKFSWDASAKTLLNAFEKHGKKKWQGSGKLWVENFSFHSENYKSLIDELTRAEGAESAPETDLKSAAISIARMQQEHEQLSRARELPASLKWRIEGPFDSSYSLALVNRSLALALKNRGHDVALHSTEGPGDFEPSFAFLEEHPNLAEMYERRKSIPSVEADVTTRLLYPPRVSNMQSHVNALHIYAWEESGFPVDWMDEFNLQLQGISCISNHVRDIMINNGASIPLAVSSSGVDHWLSVEKDASYVVPGKTFKFLHVSSCFPRKGVDILLKAYGEEFDKNDDVSLIIKTFKNPHNDVHHWLDSLKKSNDNYPDVIVIEEDLCNSQLAKLYSECDALVAPSRAEGFGLPLAEAMLLNLPVICTAWGGHLDFCNENTAWLVDFNFAKAQSHLPVSNSVWAEPDCKALGQSMKNLFSAAPPSIAEKCSNAMNLLLDNFKWADIAKRLERNVRGFAVDVLSQKASIAWITTWNTKCGIATYSSHLLNYFADTDLKVLSADDHAHIAEDEPFVSRCWTRGEGDQLSRLETAIDHCNAQILIIQFQYSFFDFFAFSKLLNNQKKKNRTILVEMHSTVDSDENPRKKLEYIAEALSICDRILVHSVEDLNRLKNVGVWKNTAILPHGVLVPKERKNYQSEAVFDIACYGFALPHKGLTQLVEAIKILKNRGLYIKANLVNSQFPDPVSEKEIRTVRSLIGSLGLSSQVSLTTEFLSDEDSMTALQEAQVIVFPYQKTGESASGAVRYGIASGRPVIVTPLSIFDDVDVAVHRFSGISPLHLADGIENIIKAIKVEDEVILEKSKNAEVWCNEHDYSRIAIRLKNIAYQLFDINQKSG
ncbi:glycosyltransferase [Paracidovorax avenae]|uniref:glycosyltransferase n=1 Tax=Paracidovorax avenae TaxID=80867 RepID=UPI00126027A8|nr:glycosyltransferase [Paracidovorax avenae]